jgi:hypothetical protein
VRAILALCALAAGCGRGPGGLDRVPEGAWGGEHVSLLVHATGAEVDLDCARGEITVPLRLDAGGAFRLPGYYVREVGPLLDPENRQPVLWSGTTDGQRLTLSFTFEGGGGGDGPFTAFAGAPAQVQQCR